MARAFGKFPSELDALTVEQAAEVIGFCRAEQYLADRERALREKGMNT